jgi:hypothetical protein
MWIKVNTYASKQSLSVKQSINFKMVKGQQGDGNGIHAHIHGQRGQSKPIRFAEIWLMLVCCERKKILFVR